MAVLAFTVACIGLNPDFEESEGAGGAADGGRGEPGSTTSEFSTSGGVDVGSAAATNSLTSSAPPNEGTTAVSSPSETTNADADDTGPDDAATTEPAESPTVVVFAAGPVQGQFATDGTLQESTAQRCSDAALSLADETMCGEGFGLVASSSYSYSAIADEHPELLELDLVAPDGQEVATSFGALSNGDVLDHFAAGVTAELTPQTTPTFWWGPADDSQGDCQLWTATNDDGRVLRFNPLDSSVELDGEAPCMALQLLLCGCVSDR